VSDHLRVNLCIQALLFWLYRVNKSPLNIVFRLIGLHVGETLYRFIKSDGLGTIAIGFKDVISNILKASWLLKLRLRL
jgi:hypothetical protein